MTNYRTETEMRKSLIGIHAPTTPFVSTNGSVANLVAVGAAVTCRPPAQIRTCGTTAYGSCLGCVTRSDPQGKDVHFWV